MAAFIWGDNGAQMTPEAIAAQRKVAQAMLAQGADYSPIQSGWQGAARVAQGVMGGLEAAQAEMADRRNVAAEKELLTSLLGGGAAAPAAVPTRLSLDEAMPGGRSVAPVATAAGPERVYTNDEPSPLDPPSGVDRDRAIRTVIAEAGNQGPTGMNAVASVIRNRAVNGGYGGNTPSGVVMARSQFEPWNTEGGRTKMAAIDPNSPEYTAAGRAVDSAYFGNDPTNGATHFYSPKAQAALGRSAPAWDNGRGVDIGGHRFFGGAPQDPAQPPYQVAGPSVAPRAAQPEQPIPAAQTVAQAMPSGVNPRLVAAMASPYISEGTKKVLGIMLQNQLQGEGVTTVDLGNKVGIMDKRGNMVRMIDKGEPNKGPTFGDTGEIDPQTGQPVKGWIDPRDKSVTPYRPQGATPAQPSSVPPVPPGVDPKVWRETFSKSAASNATPASFDDTAKVRHEVTQLPSYKNLSQAAPIYKSMVETAGRDSKASDLNLVYGLGKIFDPGSVVREGEMVMVKNTASLPDWLVGAANALNGGAALTKETRAAILREAHNRIQSYKTLYDQDTAMYRGIAERNRMNPADVIQDFGEFKPYEPPKNEPVVIDGYTIKAK